MKYRERLWNDIHKDIGQNEESTAYVQKSDVRLMATFTFEKNYASI